MHILFQKIHIENFLSIGTADITLNEGGYTLVNGINENPDDNAKSNGAGKSTIFDAITFALTGETIRGTKDVKNIFSNDGALVDLTFKVDENTYRLIRSKDHSKYKTNLKIFINDEDKSGKGIRDNTKLLEEYLPDLTSSLLGSVIILGQGLPQRFTNNTPSGRKEVLEKLSKSDFMLEDLKNRINSRKSALNLALRACEDKLLEYKSTKNLLSRQIEENKIKLSSLNDTDTIDALIEQFNSAINVSISAVNNLNENYELAKNSYQQCLNKKDEFNTELLAINKQLAEIKQNKLNLTLNLTNAINEQSNLINNTYADLKNKYNQEYIEGQSELRAKQAELTKILNIKDICPTCGQKLPGVFKPDTAELEKRIEILKTNITTAYTQYKVTVDEAEQKVKDATDKINLEYLDKFKNLDNEYKEAADKESKIKNLILTEDSNIKEINTNINRYKLELNELTNKVNNFKTKIESLRFEKETLDTKRTTAQSIIESNELQIKQLVSNELLEESNKDIINKRLDVINKMASAITRDFRGYLLVNIINYINKKAKEYCLDVFDTDKIEFKLDGNNISILYDSKDYSALSGGEKQKIDIIVQFAIRDMLCKYLGFSSNILVLDEICDNVDSYGAERLFNMISKKLRDVQDIYIISHHTDFSIPCDRQLTVIKGIDKISRVEYAI